MFVRRLTLRNVKCFEEISLDFPRTEHGGGWYVILGENGTGKSTLLQSVALAMAGPRTAGRLLENPDSWVRARCSVAECEVTFQTDRLKGFNLDEVPIGYRIDNSAFEPFDGLSFQIDDIGREAFRAFYEVNIPADDVFAGYGTFRRIELQERHAVRRASEERVRTLFFADAALNGALDTLKHVDHWVKDAPESSPERKGRQWYKNAMLGVVNRLLPEGGIVLHDVSSEGVVFHDPHHNPVSLDQLSDGYRTMFALAADMLTRVHAAEGAFRRDKEGKWFVDRPGVILIDEVEAHLHPKWQREIGFYLQRAFPRFQFIVTTHSPFVAQAATKDGLFVLRRDPSRDQVYLDTSLESVQGWRAEQILSSPAFGLESTRDPATEALIEEHGRLKAKAEAVELSPQERSRLEELTAQLEGLLPAPGNSYEVMQRLEAMLRETENPDD